MTVFSVVNGQQIPHRKTTIGSITFDAPVKVRITRGFGTKDQYAAVEMFGGEMVYALPGGGSMTESGVVLD